MVRSVRPSALYNSGTTEPISILFSDIGFSWSELVNAVFSLTGSDLLRGVTSWGQPFLWPTKSKTTSTKVARLIECIHYCHSDVDLSHFLLGQIPKNPNSGWKKFWPNFSWNAKLWWSRSHPWPLTPQKTETSEVCFFPKTLRTTLGMTNMSPRVIYEAPIDQNPKKPNLGFLHKPPNDIGDDK